jgi:RND family efflux transporter MFP subunit
MPPIESAAPAPPAAPGSPTASSQPLAPSRPLAKPSANRGELASLKIDRSRSRSTPASTKLLWIAILLALLAALVGAGYWALRDRLFPLPVVKVESVRIMTLGQAKTELTATGYLESRWQAAVGAKVPGRIANIPVEEGDVVKEGDVLAELEHSDLDAMLASRKVAVTLAEAQLAEAQSNLDQAKRDFERESDVFQRLAGARSTMERAQATYFAAQSIVGARAAAVAAAKSAVTEAEESIRNMFIYAPFAGTVLTKDAERGESIMPGGMGASSGRGSVITLAQLDKLEVDTDVKEDYLGSLRTGQPAQVLVDAVPDRRYKGRLREIIPMGDRTRGIVKVKVEILDPDERLFPELSATVNFLPEQTEAEAEASLKKGIFAPIAAIQGDGSNQFVWICEDNKVKQATIKVVGEANDGLVPVEGALVGGEQLVISPPPNLKSGDEVKIAE